MVSPENSTRTDVLIIGASASGLMCAIEAGKRGRKVIVVDHANKAVEDRFLARPFSWDSPAPYSMPNIILVRFNVN